MGRKKIKFEEYTRILVPKGTDVLGTVDQMLGNDRLRVILPNGKPMIARIRGTMRKRVWIREGDVVLISPWDFEPDKGDIYYRYTKEQVKELKKRGYRIWELREKPFTPIDIIQNNPNR